MKSPPDNQLEPAGNNKPEALNTGSESAGKRIRYYKRGFRRLSRQRLR